jgi:AdoMet-dependent heme synthase
VTARILQNLLDKAVDQLVTYVGSRKTLTMQIDITNACNLTCSHCYHPHHQNEGALALADWYLIFDQYEELLSRLRRAPSIIICGGEPTLSPFLKPILTNLNNRWNDVPVTILTNGTTIREPFLDWISAFKVDFQVSFDGPDSERHNSVRGVRAFERSVAGVKRLRAANSHVVLLSILSKRTSPWISEFFELAKSLDVQSMNFTRLIAEGTGRKLVEDGQDRPLIGSELRDAYLEILSQSRKAGIPTKTSGPLWTLIEKGLGGPSDFGFDGLVIDYKGNLKVSSRTPFVLGSVLEHGLAKLFLEHPVLDSMRKRKNFRICGGCPYFTECGGDRNSAFAASGDYLAPDPGCWIVESQLKEVSSK